MFSCYLTETIAVDGCDAVRGATNTDARTSYTTYGGRKHKKPRQSGKLRTLNVMGSHTRLSIAMISDSKFAMPTAVCIASLKASKLDSNRYDIYVIDAGLTPDDRTKLSSLTGNGLNIEYILPMQNVGGLHNPSADTIASATESALHKFHLPNLLPDEDRVLYLDADTLVREDISWLANEPFQGKAAFVVADSAALYYRHSIVAKVSRYFNSGFMLLNLAYSREAGLTSELVRIKKEQCTGLLVDQDAFNLALEGKVHYLSVRYNCLCSNIERSKDKLKISDLNRLYSTNYRSIEEVYSDAAIVHFASRDKPWKFSDVPYWNDWYRLFKQTPFQHPKAGQRQGELVSVIIPVYNIDRFLPSCLDSIVGQSYKNIEVICVNDGSADRSLAVLEAYAALDDRLIVVSQENRGQSVARNVGLGIAKGKYCYFMDGDDSLDLNAISVLYKLAELDRTDIIFFDGQTSFESDYLANRFSQFKTAYQRKITDEDVNSGIELVQKMIEMRDFKPSVCLQFFRTEFLRTNQIYFVENVIYEDNVFSLQAILLAARCRYLPRVLFERRIRSSSTMTSPPSLKSLVSNIVVASKINDLQNFFSAGSEIREFIFDRIDYFLSQAHKDRSVIGEMGSDEITFEPGSTESLYYRLTKSRELSRGNSYGLYPDQDSSTAPRDHVANSVEFIRQTRKAGRPVTALRMIRQLSPLTLYIIYEWALAEVYSFSRRLRKGLMKLCGI